MRISEEFCGQEKGYPISKTLRFELKPCGKTLENIEKEKIIERDFNRSQDYEKVKTILDNYHKFFIDDVLKDVNLDWSNLADVLIAFNKNKEDDSKVVSEQTTIRNEIVKIFKKDERFDVLTKSTPDKFFEKYIVELLTVDGNSEVNREVIGTFKKFSTYFTGYQKNRNNVYSSNDIPTAVPYRIVNDNFPKFLKNAESFKKVKDKYPEIIEQVESELSEYLNGEKLSDIFSINSYNKYLTQKGAEYQRGIDFYNQIIGGVVQKGNSVKKCGLNEFLNLYYQTHSGVEKVKFIPLYKQILSDRSSLSFKIQIVNDDKELKEGIQLFEQNINKKDDDGKTIFDKIEELVEHITEYDLSEIYINQKDINNVSKILTGDWAFLQKRMNVYAEETLKKDEKKRWIKDFDSDNSKSKIIFSLKELNDVLEYSSDNCPSVPIHIQDYFNETKRLCVDKETGEYVKDEKTTLEPSIVGICKTIKSSQTELDKVLENISSDTSLRDRKTDVQIIKSYLDAVQGLLHRIKPLKVNGIGDASFYVIYGDVYSSLSEVVSLYNKTRNYLTKKLGVSEKYKLNFENPTLADGWDQNREQTNTSIILLKDDKYFLGVMNAKNKPRFLEQYVNDKENCYRKMVYKQIQKPYMDLPHKFFSGKGIKTFDPPKQLYKDYKAKKHNKIIDKKVNENFDINFCRELIDWFKWAIKHNNDYDVFNFSFSETSSYNDINEFYREVHDQAYYISFTDIPESVINKMVDDGQLFLFQIYNKDFSERSNGVPNMHTLYWRELFSEKNLDEKVLKLNGQAELFYREAGVKKEITHKKDSVLVNKVTAKGRTIPKEFYNDIYKVQNGMLEELPDETMKYLLDNRIIIKDREKDATTDVENDGDVIYTHKAGYDLVKDKHYTEPKFLFHVPITINYKAHGSSSMNERVRTFLKNNNDVNIIGLDRGERNLIYLSLINQKGEIIDQFSLNEVEHSLDGRKVDYHEKLDTCEKERDNARKNWETIGKIAELKEGYLSAVIHKITKLMIENNAIVVMEDLNFGFKRGRFHVEKQVYQKFEQMLIDKLNYLVFKSKTSNETGGVLNGYQLTDKFVSFKKLGKQSGFLFYVPAGYTSVIDPKTGFVNVFDLSGITNVQKKREFFKKFESIKYDKETESFAFTFDYKSFDGRCKEMFKIQWTVYSRDKRIVYSSKNRKYEDVYPTEKLIECFDNANIKWDSGEDLLPAILKIGAELKSGDKPSSDVASFYDSLFRNFKLTLQLRNSNANTDEDYILSPVKGEDETFFDSRNNDHKFPIDADANGAYHIALKGLELLKRINETDETNPKKLKISNQNWFKFVQNKEYLK